MKLIKVYLNLRHLNKKGNFSFLWHWVCQEPGIRCPAGGLRMHTGSKESVPDIPGSLEGQVDIKDIASPTSFLDSCSSVCLQLGQTSRGTAKSVAFIWPG